MKAYKGVKTTVPDLQPRNFVITMYVPSKFLTILKNHPLSPGTKKKKKIQDFQDQMQLFIPAPFPPPKKRKKIYR